jgi:hypothetical protein
MPHRSCLYRSGSLLGVRDPGAILRPPPPGEIGGFVQLLDGVRYWYESDVNSTAITWIMAKATV